MKTDYNTYQCSISTDVMFISRGARYKALNSKFPHPTGGDDGAVGRSHERFARPSHRVLHDVFFDGCFVVALTEQSGMIGVENKDRLASGQARRRLLVVR